MYIKRLVLENIRGFRNLDFSLQRQDNEYAGWTVFTGDNGSGKSALLKAIAVALNGTGFARSLQSSFSGWVRAGEKEAALALELVPTDRDDSFQQSGKTSDAAFWAELALKINGGREPAIERSTKYTGKRKTAARGPWAENPIGWFSCGYGPFRRIQGASSEAQRLMVGPGQVSRFVTLFREDASLAECDQWLRALKFKEMEQDTDAARRLAVVMELLNDEMLQNDMRVERVDSEGMWLRDKAGVVLPLADMSDGYRAALALLVDIVRHLMDVFGTEALVVSKDGAKVVPRSGVVLIDEIDSHLHPEWQRRIGFWLKQHFPRIQFIVTSHSPFICQASDRNGLFRLPPPGGEEQPFAVAEVDRQKVIASKSDTILLGPAFGLRHTRSQLAVSRRQRFAELQAKRSAGESLSAAEKKDEQLCLPFVADE